MASTFHFSPADIRGLELSHEPIDGLFYWYELAAKLADEIENAGKGR